MCYKIICIIMWYKRVSALSLQQLFFLLSLTAQDDFDECPIQHLCHRPWIPALITIDLPPQKISAPAVRWRFYSITLRHRLLARFFSGYPLYLYVKTPLQNKCVYNPFTIHIISRAKNSVQQPWYTTLANHLPA